jgi:hypothetical protein
LVPITYVHQKAKKGKPCEMDLPLLKNDITLFFFGHDMCVIAVICKITFAEIRNGYHIIACLAGIDDITTI